jgi:hypothetical protein
MSESPLRVIRPLVVPAQFFVVCLQCLLLTGLCALMVAILWEKNLFALLFVPLGGLSLALLPFAAVRFLLHPRYAEYKVFPDRVEYYEGFFIRRFRTVAFDQEMDVRLEEGFLQRAKGVGTVRLVTRVLVPGQDGQPVPTRNSIAMWNVPEPQQVYELIRSLMRGKPPATPQDAESDKGTYRNAITAEPGPATDRPRD